MREFSPGILRRLRKPSPAQNQDPADSENALIPDSEPRRRRKRGISPLFPKDRSSLEARPLPAAGENLAVDPGCQQSASPTKLESDSWEALWTSQEGVAPILWKKAYMQLKEKEPELVKAYEEAFNGHHHESQGKARPEESESSGHGNPDDRSNASSEAKLHVLNIGIVTTLILETYGKEMHSAARVENYTNITIGVLNRLSPVLNIYPTAKPMWDMIMDVIPALLKPITNQVKLARGLRQIVEELDRKQPEFKVLLRRTWNDDGSFSDYRDNLEGHIINYFVLLLKYQVQAVCRVYASGSFVTGIKDILGADDWIESDLDAIKTTRKSLYVEIDTYLRQAMLSGVDLLGNKAREEISQDKFELISKFKTALYEDSRDSQRKPEEGTCQWFLKNQKFRDWLAGDTRRLLVFAGPGCGKSVLSRFLVDEVIPTQDRSATICYYFFMETQEQKSSSVALCALLHQLFCQRRNLVTHFREAIFQEGKTVTSNVTVLVDIWQKATVHHGAGDIYLVIDALDQCNVNERERFLQGITPRNNSSKMKILITAKGKRADEKMLQSYDFHYQIPLSGETDAEKNEICDEIKSVVQKKVHNLAEILNWDEEEEEWMRNLLQKKGEGEFTYLWLDNIYNLLQSKGKDNPRRRDLQELVNDLTQSVGATYHKLLAEVKPANKRMIRNLLELILVARRPLSLQEMNIALHILEEGTEGGDAELETQIEKINGETRFRNWIHDQLNFFVTVHNNKLSLIHPTAYEWLRKDSALTNEHTFSDSEWQYSIDLETAERTMVNSCLAYLNLRDFEQYSNGIELLTRSCPTEIESLKEQHPFLEYTATHWISHFKAAQNGNEEEVDGRLMVDKASNVLGLESNKFFPWYWINDLGRKRFHDPQDPSQTGLMAAIHLRLHRVILRMLEKEGLDLNRKSLMGRTALHSATLYGDVDMLHDLMSRGADSSIKDNHGRTALHLAVYRRDEEMVNLLANHSNVDVIDSFGLTACQLTLRTMGLRTDGASRRIYEILESRSARPHTENEMAEVIQNRTAVEFREKELSIFIDSPLEDGWSIAKVLLLDHAWGMGLTPENRTQVFFSEDFRLQSRRISRSLPNSEFEGQRRKYYNLVEQFFVNYVNEIDVAADHLEAEGCKLNDALALMEWQWSKYKNTAKHAHFWLMFLDPVVIMRMVGEGRRSRSLVPDLPFEVWKEKFECKFKRYLEEQLDPTAKQIAERLLKDLETNRCE